MQRLLILLLVHVQVALVLASGQVAVRRGSSTSDYGKFEVYASGKDALLYFTHDDDAPKKIHVLLSIPSCYCIGAADIHKINQFDYLAARGDCYSFGIYVNDGLFQNRERCNLDTASLQARTELAFNPLGSPAAPAIRRREVDDDEEASPSFSHSLSLSLSQSRSHSQSQSRSRSRSHTHSKSDSSLHHKPTSAEELFKQTYQPKPRVWERVEGAVLAMGMRDYYEHSHVTTRQDKIFQKDAPGGFLFMQGTVMVRPCRLQWYLPFIFSPHGEHRLMKYTLPYDAKSTSSPDYYTEDDAVLLNTIFERMRAKGIINDAHLGNLGLNNLATYNVRAFEFSAAFVPFRRAKEFLALLEPFAYTGLWPWVYVPLVYQMMFAPGDWEHLRLDDNETIAQGEPLMFSCRAETIETAAENVNTESAKTLFYYGYSYCGRGLIDTTYVISRAKSIISFYWERFAAVILSLFILCVVLFVFRRRNMASGRRGRARRRGWLVCAMECAARMCPSLFRSRYYKKLTRDEDEKQEQGTPLVETPADATGAGTGVGGSAEQSSALRVVDDEEKTGSADF